jgi:hypothetical protein
LIDHAASTFPSTYGWLAKASSRDRQVLEALIAGLGHGIDYASMDPVILSEVYGEALVTDNDRRQLGIHYTPPRLANKILEYMPVEVIAPELRDVLDPACGSGTLLVAAHDRLRALQPPNWSVNEQHSDLAVHLRGIDIDPFAAEIAENALFLHANPAGNGWQIAVGDTLRIDPGSITPSIIVTNPPWRYTSAGGSRHQAASDFLAWCMQALNRGGLLGIIMPLSWLSTNSASGLRSQVQERVDVFEIWRLPENLFESSQMSAALLIGRKRDGLGGTGCRVVREVHSEGLQRFLRADVPTANYVVSDTSDELWKTVEFPDPDVSVCSLESLAVIRSGPQPRAGLESRLSGTPFLNQFRDVRPYAAVDRGVLWHVGFPEDFQTARGRSIIDKKKVLVSAARTVSDPWRLRVSLDTIGVAFRNSMRGVAPHDQADDVLLHALLIILGSGLATVYAASYGFDRNVPARVLRDFPIPTDERWIGRLGEIGFSAASYATLGHMDALASILAEAEPLVWEAYGFSAADQRELTQRLAGAIAPEGSVRYASRTPDIDVGVGFRRFGCVLDVNGYEVKLWVNGVTPSNGVGVSLPERMPGWLVRPGATFDVFGVEEPADLDWATYRLQPAAWSDLDLASEVPRSLADLNLIPEVS